MYDYRLLSDEEIGILEENGCTAEDWTSLNVDYDFNPAFIRNVRFYGTVNLGVFEKNIEVTNGFMKHTTMAATKNMPVMLLTIRFFIIVCVLGIQVCYIS